MLRKMTRFFAVFLLVASAGCASQIQELSAEGPAAQTKVWATSDATEVAQSYRTETEGSDIDTGGAVILVNAPLEDVLAVVQDFKSYHDIFPRLHDSRVVMKSERGTDVYLRAPILHGLIKVWAIARFAPPAALPNGGKRLVGDFVEGNIDTWHGVWTLEPLAADRTALRLEMSIELEVPVPDSLITPELMWVSEEAVTAVRDRAVAAQKSSGTS
jgi:ribosome-associated toxin RatA of RatAB toxin-antitoxin module